MLTGSTNTSIVYVYAFNFQVTPQKVVPILQGPSFIEINGTGITYNPAEGFTVDRSVVNQNQSHKFMCKQGSHRDREVIYDSPLTPPKIVNDTGIIKKFQQLSLGCAILTNRTWDYISNIYATTQMEADMLQDCLYRVIIHY